MLLLVALCRTQLCSKLTTLIEEFCFQLRFLSFGKAFIFKLLWFPGFIFTGNCLAFLEVSLSDHYVCSLMFLMSLAELLLHFYCLTFIKLAAWNLSHCNENL